MMRLAGYPDHDRILANDNAISHGQIPEFLPDLRSGRYPRIGINVVDIRWVHVQVVMFGEIVQNIRSLPAYRHIRCRQGRICRGEGKFHLRSGNDDFDCLFGGLSTAIGDGSQYGSGARRDKLAAEVSADTIQGIGQELIVVRRPVDLAR